MSYPYIVRMVASGDLVVAGNTYAIPVGLLQVEDATFETAINSAFGGSVHTLDAPT